MIAIREPISRLIVLTHNYKNVITKPSIQHQIEDLIDIITFRLHNKSIESVANSVLEKIFDLRFELLDWFFTNNQNKNLFQELQEQINIEIASKIQLSLYSNLAKTTALVLDAYARILAPVSENFSPNDLEQFSKNIEDNKFSYSTLNLLSSHPSPQIQHLKKWVDASLKLDFGLIVADLTLTEQINLSDDKVEQLMSFLDNTLIKYGAYSIFTEFWRPEENDTSNLTNSMEILAATIELDSNLFHKSTQDNLYHLINN